MMRSKKAIKKLIALLLCVGVVLAGSSAAAAAAAPAKLTDIAGNTYESILTKWVESGFVSGYPDGTFRPANKATRAEFMVMTNKAFKLTETIPVKFTDIKKADWFYNDVEKASKAGYMNGFAGKIYPRDNISRQEFASVVSKLAKLDTKVDDKLLSQFTDLKAIPSWSKGAVSATMAKGLFEGFVDKQFKPTESVTRVEIVVVLDRVLAYLTPPEDLPADVPEGSAIIPGGFGGGGFGGGGIGGGGGTPPPPGGTPPPPGSAVAKVDFVGTTYVRVLVNAGVDAVSVSANGAGLTFNPATGKWGGTFNTLAAGDSVTIEVKDVNGIINKMVILVDPI